MTRKQLASLFASSVLLLALGVPAFAEDPAELPADAVQPEQTTVQAEETPAPSAEEPQPEAPAQHTYVALGDSITAGVGLTGLKFNAAPIGYDLSPNFEGYSDQCYVAKVASSLGLDRQHAINLGLPGLMSGDMLDLVRTGAMPQMNQPSGTYYVYPEYQEYLRTADIISIQIGSNDALVPCIVGLGNATNWKSEKLANAIVSGSLRNFTFATLNAFLNDLSSLKLTRAETAATNKLLNSGMKEICSTAYNEVTANLPQIVQSIRELNPDAQIVLLGYTNPVPLLPVWTDYFNKLNRFEKDLAAQKGLTYVAIPCTQTAMDGHPTIAGQRYIGRQLSRALKKLVK